MISSVIKYTRATYIWYINRNTDASGVHRSKMEWHNCPFQCKSPIRHSRKIFSDGYSDKYYLVTRKGTDTLR